MGAFSKLLKILRVYQSKNPCYKKAQKATQKGILVHSTGAVNRELRRYVDAPEYLGENQYNNHWNKSDANKCVHAFIGYDKDKNVVVAQTLPYEYACWGCGKGDKGSYNRDPVAHIQFEICEGSKTDAEYYAKVIEVAEEYCVHLCKLFGWSADQITSHREAHEAGYASNHGDPQSYMKNFGDNIDKFRSRVAARLNGAETGLESVEIKTEEIPAQEEKTAQNASQEGKKVNIELTTLKSGSRGREVKTVQRLFNSLGFGCGGVDGIFGSKTLNSAKSFQKAKGLDVDGVVGKDTWNALLK